MKQKRTCRMLALLLAIVLALAMPAGAVSYDDEGNELTVIVLDPGHGGIDTGTEAEHDGIVIEEAALNLKIAGYCRDYLLEHYQGVRVLLTHEEHVKMTLDERIAFAVEAGADYLLSIHLNSNDGRAKGALALVPRGKYRPEQAEASVAAAEAILEHLAELGLTNRGTTYTTNSDRYPDGSYKDSFAIVRGGVENDIPAIIMEHCFLDNYSDYVNHLSTEEQLAALGRADALGLAESLGLEEKRDNSSADLGDTPFEDVTEGVWFYDDVTYVWEEGLMQGISDTEFGPALPANRAMVVTLLYRLDGTMAEYDQSSFADVEPGSWYHAPVEWALETGITTGVSETEFAPGRNVIREQFVTFLHRYAGSPEPTVIPEAYTDWEDTSVYARNSLAWAVEIGLLTGYEDGTVRPLRELNRAELAVLMHRFHRWLLHESGELTYEWTISETEKALYVGESFELTITNQYGEVADVEWSMDTEGVVEIDGATVTAVGEGSVLLTAELEGGVFECFVEVTEKIDIWTISQETAALTVGESFELTIINQYGELADVEWSMDTEGVVEIDGTTVTAVGEGSVLLTAELEGENFACFVEVTEETHTWTISHDDVTIQVGESFYLRLRNEDGEQAAVDWSASKSGYVSISGSKITGKAKGTVTVSCEFEGITYKCIVRVKSA